MVSALLIALFAVTAPLFAWASELIWGFVPCLLCRWQRWPYWVAAGAAIAAALVTARRRRSALLRLAAVAALTSAIIAAFHLGVENGWWPSPLPGCAGLTAIRFDRLGDPLLALPATPAPPCDIPAFLIPGLPFSMAAMNLLYGLGLGLFAWQLGRRL